MSMTETEAVEDVVVYNEGFFYASVCSCLSQEETERFMTNQTCGTSKGWTLTDEGFSDGKPNPCPCNTDHKRKHYLFAA